MFITLTLGLGFVIGLLLGLLIGKGTKAVFSQETIERLRREES
jgi:hypothetical protein